MAVALRPQQTPNPIDINALEFAGFQPIMAAGHLGLSGTLPDVPMAILTSVQVGNPPAFSAARRKVWRDLHAELFQQSSYGMHIVTSKSGHYIHHDEPELALSAIRFVLDRARTASPR